MIGQNKLKRELLSIPSECFPQTILLCGESGCGKHTLVTELASKLNQQVIDITQNISLDCLEEINLRTIGAIYLIDLNCLNERQQNIILKFIEEPGKSNHIILICTSKNIVLETILNRCLNYCFEKYSKEELQSFVTISDTDVLDVCTTPGQIQSLSETNLMEIKNLCNTICDKLHIARFSNTLTLVNKFNYKDTYDKFNVEVFFNVLLKTVYNRYVLENNIKYLKLYNTTREYKNKLVDSRINKEIFMTNFFITIWKLVRE